MKEIFLLKFPQSKETTQVECNIFSVRSIAAKYLKEQPEIKGNVCYICRYEDEEVIAVVFMTDFMQIRFFIEDDSTEDVPKMID